MLLFFIPLIGVMLISELFRNSHPRINRTLTSTGAVITLCVILAAWGIARNL